MRAPFILVWFLTTAGIFAYVSLTDIASKQELARKLSARPDNVSVHRQGAAAEPAAPPVPGVRVMTIEGDTFDWDFESLAFAEQLERQSDWLNAEPGAAVDEELVTENSPYDHDTPYPSQHNETLDARGLLLLEKAKKADNDLSIVRRWNPVTGDMHAILVLHAAKIHKCLATEYENYCMVRDSGSPTSRAEHLVFVSALGGRGWVQLTEARDDPRVARLPDGSVVLVGGLVADTGRQTPAVERVTKGPNGLEVERLPDIPGPVRWGYATVVLEDGRLMVVGGNTDRYKGCKAPDCTDKTYILNPETGQWTEGPTLNDARAAATASLLEDGSVVVAGGWTTDRAGNAIPSRSTERLGPGASRFERDGPLPLRMAGHRAFQLTDGAPAPVLLMDESGKSVVGYDSEQGEWRIVGGFSSFTSFALGPFATDREHFFWVSAARETEWSRQVIGLRGYAPRGMDPKSATLQLYRAGSAYLAAATGQPALLVGGHAAHPFRLVTTVDSYSDDAGLQALSPVATGRYDAQVFRLQDGAVAVAGGVGETGTSTRYLNAKAPPVEFLRRVSTDERWTTLEFGHPKDTRYARAGDSALVAVMPGRAVERLAIDFAAADKPRIGTRPLPPLPVHRESGTQAEDRVVARRLGDGRLVVAGGHTYDKRIAVYDERTDAIVDYVGYGNLVPANTYEVFDPASGRWATSRQASRRGGEVVVQENGRLVKLGIEPRGQDANGKWQYSVLFELGHADTGQWQTLQMVGAPYVEVGTTRLISVGNELFVSGLSERTIGIERKRILQWFDGEQQAWKTVWEEPDSSLRARNQDVLARVEVTGGRKLLVPIGGT